jgi:hypothetical protein
MTHSAGLAAGDVVGFALGQVRSYLRAQGVLSVGEETDPDLLPDAEGDAPPQTRMPPGTRLPKRQPRLGAGRLEHPLPDLSEQDAAKMARMLADERAKLQEQSESGASDEPAPSGNEPSATPPDFLPAQRRAELRGAAQCMLALRTQHPRRRIKW